MEGIKMYTYWNDNEINLLKTFYMHYEKKELLSILQGRSWSSIIRKANRLGLTRKRFRIWNKGKHLSENHKRRISKALDGKYKINIPKNKLKQLYIDEKLSTIKIAKLYETSTAIVLDRMSEYGIKLRTRSEALKGRIISDETKLKISKANKGKHLSPSTEFKKGSKAPKKWRILWSKIMKEKWKDPQFVEKIMEARNAQPNKPETKVLQLMEYNQLPFSYSGDGKATIGGLCPDFVHSDGDNKVIEIFGRVFHDPEKSFFEVPWAGQYWGRLARYSQSGYDCLILWDDELDDEIEVVEKIRRFMNG